MSKHQFTDIRVAIEPDNPAVQRLEFKCIKCGSCKAVWHRLYRCLRYLRSQGDRRCAYLYKLRAVR